MLWAAYFTLSDNLELVFSAAGWALSQSAEEQSHSVSCDLHHRLAASCQPKELRTDLWSAICIVAWDATLMMFTFTVISISFLLFNIFFLEVPARDHCKDLNNMDFFFPTIFHAFTSVYFVMTLLYYYSTWFYSWIYADNHQYSCFTWENPPKRTV